MREIIKKFLFVFLLLFSTFLILVVVEIICLLNTNELERDASPFINSEAIRRNENMMGGSVDPLLGFALDDNLMDMYEGGKKYDSAILPNTNEDCADTLIILISGGSTSDVISGQGTWPNYLQQILMENNICASIKVAATSGYHSGQELLKVIKYYSFYKPDIHISYSGVNEPGEYRYTTEYEERIFLSKIEPKSFVLPYTVHFMRRRIGLKLSSVNLRLEVPKVESHEFWKQNMRFMYSIAKVNNSNFLAVLQPSLGVGPHKDQVREVFEKNTFSGEFGDLEWTISKNKEFYKHVIPICSNYAYIHDFTNIFENETKSPFYDDCHIEEEYQIKLAKEIYVLIEGQLKMREANITKTALKLACK